MSISRVNTTVTPAQLEVVREGINVIHQPPTFLIDHKPDVGQGMVKFDEKDRIFVAKAAAVTNLLGKLEDTHFAAGNQAYIAELLIYQYAKTTNLATGVVEDALNQLGHRFVKHPKNLSHPNASTPHHT